MIRHNRENMYLDVVPFSCFANAGFAKAFILELGKHIVAIFCLPIHVPEIYANLMVVIP